MTKDQLLLNITIGYLKNEEDFSMEEFSNEIMDIYQINELQTDLEVENFSNMVKADVLELLERIKSFLEKI